MYGEPTMICFKYQVYLYCSKAITYLNAIYFEWLQRQHYEYQTAPTPNTGSPPPLYGSITHLEKNSSMVKFPCLC
jgi:hypothetical protein